jgi:hypothetical protein
VAGRPPGLGGPGHRGGDDRRQPGGGREGLSDRADRSGGVRVAPGRHPLPVSVRVRAVPARPAGMVDRAASPRRAPPDRRRRRRPHLASPRLHREPRPCPAPGGRPADRRGGAALQRRRRRGPDGPPGHRARRGHARARVGDRLDAVRAGGPGPSAARPAAADPPGARSGPRAHRARLPRRRPGPRGGAPNGTVAGRAPTRAGRPGGDGPDRPVQLRGRGPPDRRLVRGSSRGAPGNGVRSRPGLWPRLQRSRCRPRTQSEFRP